MWSDFSLTDNSSGSVLGVADICRLGAEGLFFDLLSLRNDRGPDKSEPEAVSCASARLDARAPWVCDEKAGELVEALGRLWAGLRRVAARAGALSAAMRSCTETAK